MATAPRKRSVDLVLTGRQKTEGTMYEGQIVF